MQQLRNKNEATPGDRPPNAIGRNRPSGGVLLMVVFLVGFLTDPAIADDRKPLGVYGDWQAYTFDDDGAKACYIASAPTKKDRAIKKRGEEIFAIVTHRPSDRTRDVVSLLAGYDYKETSFVEVAIDGRKFELMPYGSIAWAPDPNLDRRLVAAMRAGNTMIVRGTAASGSRTQDTYSLTGFTKAYRAINKACGF